MIVSNLPETLIINNKTVLKRVSFYDERQYNNIILNCKNTKNKYRTIYCLHKNLQNKKDLHGEPYKPTKHLFIEKE